ncbi:MAG: D-TA family PLP-dependent enzyme [Pseudolabrys sp.]|nr:D-TA family PLP-dependent enzyme [Pseudolabrys sp.]
MKHNNTAWYNAENVADVASPALLVYPERIEANVRQLIAIAGGTQRLRPHVKTHKLPEIVRIQRELGIEKFKCATIAEAEMVAGCGAAHVLLAYQPVGPNVVRLVQLIEKYPATRFAAIVDNAASIRAIAQAAEAKKCSVELLLDLDCGMCRTGLAPGAEAVELYRLIAGLPGAELGGLHAYDGHIHDSDLAARTAATLAAFAPVTALRTQLLQQGLPVRRTVVGGTPTFPIHARDKSFECSPGTCVLSDAGYGIQFPDLNFSPAALVLTRVISKPGMNRLCLDLGHKAIASENPPPRVQLLGLPDAVPVMHNEEHLVLETPRAAEFAIGDVLYGIPWHICPTVALHAFAVVVRAGRARERWKIVARDRALTI